MEFETEDLMFLGMGILGGFLALFVMKSTHPSVALKIITFLCTTIAGYFVSKFIMSR